MTHVNDVNHEILPFVGKGGMVRCVTVFPRAYFDLSNPDGPASRARAAAAAWRRSK